MGGKEHEGGRVDGQGARRLKLEFPKLCTWLQSISKEGKKSGQYKINQEY